MCDLLRRTQGRVSAGSRRARAIGWDAVARFHLRNGARVERINWMGDSSADGIRQSAGLMANYVYQLNELERNHERYTRGEISASSRVERLARQLVRDENPNWLMRRLH